MTSTSQADDRSDGVGMAGPRLGAFPTHWEAHMEMLGKSLGFREAPHPAWGLAD